MKKTLTILAALCLFLAVSASGQFRRTGFEARSTDKFETKFAGRDTVYIIEELFSSGLDGWTEAGGVAVGNVSYGHTYLDEDFDTGSLAGWSDIGGVALIVKPGGATTDSVLKVTVSGGGTDQIYQTIDDRDEVWLSFDFFLTDADTSGWGSTEIVGISRLAETSGNNGAGYVAIVDINNELKWRVVYYDDDGGATTVNSDILVETNTWYSLLWHVKKAAAAGADNGIASLKVDGIEVIAVTDWDNEAATYAKFYAGYTSSPLDAIYYIDNVLLQGEPNKGLVVTVVGGGSDYIEQTIPSCSEYWLRMNVFIPAADTSGWNDGEKLYFAAVKNVDTDAGYFLPIAINSGGSLKWGVYLAEDDAGAFTVTSTTSLNTDTWYTVLIYGKKATADGADNGICTLWIDGTQVATKTDWDNDATVYNRLSVGRIASALNCIYYIDDVVLFSPESLP